MYYTFLKLTSLTQSVQVSPGDNNDNIIIDNISLSIHIYIYT